MPRTKRGKQSKNIPKASKRASKIKSNRKPKLKGMVKVAPVSISRQVRVGVPQFKADAKGGCTITHYEYIADVVGGAGNPSAYSVAGYSINPGMAATFPWLSSIARNYESYSFQNLKFRYEPTAPSTLGGTVLLAIDYDAVDGAPVSKAAAMSYASSVRTSPWAAVVHNSLGQNLHKNKTNFVRVGPQPAGTDLKTYDIGNLFVATAGIGSANATVGELYVEYTVKFMTPQTLSQNDIVGGSIKSGGIKSAEKPFGDAPLIPETTIGVTVDAKSGIITLEQPGTYYFSVVTQGSSLPGDTKIDEGKGMNVVDHEYLIRNSANTYESDIWTIAANVAGAYFYYYLTSGTVTSCEAHVSRVPTGST